MGGMPKKAHKATVQGQEEGTTTAERNEPNRRRQVAGSERWALERKLDLGSE